MTVRELLEQLKMLPDDFLDTNVVCNVGVLRRMVHRQLKDDAEWNLPISNFLDVAVGVSRETEIGETGDDEPIGIIIHAGAELEIPPIL